VPTGETFPPSPPLTPRVPRRTLTVRVICPYEALEDGEINLVEDEYIYDVEQVDDGSWRGTTADGKRGLFPASYVEECAAHTEAGMSPPVPTATLAPEPGNSGGQRSQQRQKKRQRKGRDDDDDSRFTQAPQLQAPPPGSSARRRSGRQKNRFLALDDD
jgi:hypothetical protein